MEEILKSIKEEMAKKKEEYEKVMQDISTLNQNYRAMLNQLESNKEQLIGAYAALNAQYVKFNALNENNKNEKEVKADDSVVENKKIKEQNVENKDNVVDLENNKKDSKQDDLSESQKAILEKIKKIVPQNKPNNTESDDVPDYLK